MNLEWHTRLIERMIKNNPDATIKHYYQIVDKEEQNELGGVHASTVNLVNIEKKTVNEAIEVLDEKINEIEASLVKKRNYKTKFFQDGLKDVEAGKRPIYIETRKGNPNKRRSFRNKKTIK